MTEIQLRKLVKDYDKDAELKRDGTREFRIFLFSSKKRYPITNALDKRLDIKITRISEYDNTLDKTKPKIVISLNSLYIRGRKRKA